MIQWFTQILAVMFLRKYFITPPEFKVSFWPNFFHPSETWSVSTIVENWASWTFRSPNSKLALYPSATKLINPPWLFKSRNLTDTSSMFCGLGRQVAGSYYFPQIIKWKQFFLQIGANVTDLYYQSVLPVDVAREVLAYPHIFKYFKSNCVKSSENLCPYRFCGELRV